MLRVLSQVAVTMVFATALGAAPGNSTPDSKQPGTPGQIQEKTKSAKVKPAQDRKSQVGKASWYGRFFQHKKTASGEPYDMYQLTAAHRTLPLGSWIKVTNLRNDRSVIVRVNDRGPMPKNRILDLSYSAAKLLDMAQDGVDPVRLEVLPTALLAENEGVAEAY